MDIPSRPVLRFALREDGQIERISPWFPVILVDAALLSRVDGRRVLLSKDEIEFRCSNGGADYELGPEQDGTRVGRLVRHWYI